MRPYLVFAIIFFICVIRILVIAIILNRSNFIIFYSVIHISYETIIIRSLYFRWSSSTCFQYFALNLIPFFGFSWVLHHSWIVYNFKTLAICFLMFCLKYHLICCKYESTLESYMQIWISNWQSNPECWIQKCYLLHPYHKAWFVDTILIMNCFTSYSKLIFLLMGIVMEMLSNTCALCWSTIYCYQRKLWLLLEIMGKKWYLRISGTPSLCFMEFLIWVIIKMLSYLMRCIRFNDEKVLGSLIPIGLGLVR